MYPVANYLRRFLAGGNMFYCAHRLQIRIKNAYAETVCRKAFSLRRPRGNVAVSVTKFAAAALTGSSAMLSEGLHSLVDTINELLCYME